MPPRPSVGPVPETPEVEGLLSALGAPNQVTEPLAVNYPSVGTLLQYPLIATHVRILCKNKKQEFNLKTMFSSLQTTFKKDGVLGLYHGAHLYALHQAARDVLRMVTERALRFVEGQRGRSIADKQGQNDKEGKLKEQSQQRYQRRLVAKYLIDAMVYPILLSSTRSVILAHDPHNMWEHLCRWVREEGFLVLFNGLIASLLQTALDEIMDNVMAKCIDYCSAGNDIELTEKMLLKASGSSVVSSFTSLVNYVGVIQRCQSRLPGMLEPEPLPSLVRGLPWRSCGMQFMLYGGMMAVNVKLIQMKVQFREEEEEERRTSNE